MVIGATSSSCQTIDNINCWPKVICAEIYELVDVI